MTIVLFVALVPVSISTYTMLSVHQQSANQRLAELHQKTAELGAAHSQSYVDNAVQVLDGLIRHRVDWPALTEAERPQVLWLIYEQLENVVVVSLLDEDGKGIGPSVYRDDSLSSESLLNGPVMALEDLQSYAATFRPLRRSSTSTS
ncbi:MAG: hypothetical protein GY811_16060 [Myxococcales bacterium]|nr:hypothetical protein [Myxococcales bacterium]